MTKAKRITATAPAEHRHDSLACTECGAVQWDRAPGLAKAFKRLVQRGKKGETTADLAAHLDISVPNASERLRRLVRLGIVQIIDTQNIPEVGGVINTYAVVE
jgi:hypothetical protein